MPPHLLPLGYSEAAMLLRSPTASTPTALISIHSPTEPALDLPLPIPRLDLSFDDTDPVNPADPFSRYHQILRDRWDDDTGRPRQIPPTLDHAQQILTFADTLRDRPGLLLIHCSAGISRAPAAALLCLAAWTNPGDEPACVRHLLTLRPAASPNPALIAFGDHLLQRHGHLTQALTTARPSPTPNE